MGLTREYAILGPLSVRDSGQAVPLGGRRQQAVLALLLLSPNTPVSVDRLIEGVWGEEIPEAAVKTVRAYVSRLRASLGADSIASMSGGYVLSVAPGALDADRFAASAEAGRRALSAGAPADALAHLSRALDLWRGAALSGLEGNGVIATEAARLEEQRLAAVEERFEATLACGNHVEAVAELESIVAEHPLREGFWAQLMLALYRCGRQAEALDAFQRAHQILSDELGLTPGPQLQRLQEQILLHDVAQLPAQAGNIPAAATSFVGRSNELADVSQLLAGSRLVTLVGVGGAGKTRLACEVAVASTAPAWFVDLAGVRDPALVARVTLDALDGTELRGGSVTDAVVARLRGGTDLVVLDNCEHLLDACAELASTLLSRCPDVRLLATSRESLDLPSETVFNVPPLALPDPQAPAWRAELLVGYDSVRLFVDRARAARPSLHFDDAALASVASICRRLDGLPLAIELAAARVRLMSVGELAAHLAQRSDVLTGGRGRPARHHTLRATIDWSHDLLGERERRLLRRLAVFSGGFTVPAATDVADDEDVLELLDHLVAASLVVADDEDAGVRYRLFETVREYATDRLDEAGETEQIRQRHAHHFTAFADESAHHLVGPQESVWLGRLGLEHDNLRAALSWLAESAPSEAVRLVQSMAYFWRLRGHVVESQRWLEYALSVEVEPTPVRAELLVRLGAVLVRRSEFVAAEAHLAAAVELARRLSEMKTLGLALHISGNAAGMQARYDDARLVLNQAVAVRRELGDLADLAMSLGALADMAMEQGQGEEAAALYEEGLPLMRRAGTAAGVTAYLHSMSELADVNGDDARAQALAEEALLLADGIDDKWHQGLVRIILARVSAHRGDVVAVASYIEAAVTRLWSLQEMRGIADAIEILATIVADRGRPEDAARLLAGATETRSQFGVPVAPVHQVSRDALEGRLRNEMGQTFDAAWTRGLLLPGERLVTEALAACRTLLPALR